VTAAIWALIGALIGAVIVYVAMRTQQSAADRRLASVAETLGRSMEQVHAVVGDVMTLQQGMLIKSQEHVEKMQGHVLALHDLLKNAEPTPPAEGE
jgi:uncharacterized membrane-anchored protein